MILSVVIVNYNVKYFLEQCLISVKKAIDFMKEKNPEFHSEVFVVDNNSVDSSVSMVKSKFPDCQLIANKNNVGFSAANNQAIKVAKGKYILLLNPDTVVEENTFWEAVRFFEDHPDAGGLGVKMIDGKGNFLPESKRSLPTPEVAFYKIFGFSKFFPRSKRFGKYHLSYLDENQIHEVEVLSGACFFIRKEVLDKTGLLDETFFMYGEDIDLSYRIIRAGFKNYYLPVTRIIHYKGESTKKSSVNYVITFYKAMIIFAQKHFTGGKAWFFSVLIHLAIYLRAFLAISHRLFNALILPVADMVLIYLGLNAVRIFWENVGHGIPYPRELIIKYFPLYTLIWVLSLAFVRGHVKPFSIGKITRGILLGAVVISIFYAFLSESERFSRAIIILGTLSSFMLTFFNRLVISYIQTGSLRLNFNKNLRIGIIGKQKEYQRVRQLLDHSAVEYSFCGNISPDEQNIQDEDFIGNVSQIDEIVKIYKLNELIFCAEDISSSRIIRLMTSIGDRQLIYKIAPPQSLFIIGSNHKNKTGDLYTIDIQLSLLQPENKFNKRMFDITSAALFLIFSPLLVWLVKDKKGFFRNLLFILSGKISWVGFNPHEDLSGFPSLKKGIFYPGFNTSKTTEVSGDLNLFYARDYNLMTDIQILLRNFHHAGRQIE
ncbi:MAG TPA: glycosyltransferase [Bacteroidia bacterium]|nr:glycosyltransferase [Bacteroidia bacterium]